MRFVNHRISWRMLPKHVQDIFHHQIRMMPNLKKALEGADTHMALPLNLTPEQAILLLGTYNPFVKALKGASCSIKMMLL